MKNISWLLLLFTTSIPSLCTAMLFGGVYAKHAHGTDVSSWVMIIIIGVALLFQIARIVYKNSVRIGVSAVILVGLVGYGSIAVISYYEQQKIDYVAVLRSNGATEASYIITVKRMLAQNKKEITYQAYTTDPAIPITFKSKAVYRYNDQLKVSATVAVKDVSPTYTRITMTERVLKNREQSFIGTLVFSTQTYLSGLYQAYLKDETLGIVEGIVLGMQTHIPYWFSVLFRDVGISHIIVLSGYNILLVYEGLFLLGRNFFGRTLIVGVSLMISYILVLVAGNTEASSRAYQSIVVHEGLRMVGVMPSIERTILYILTATTILTLEPLNYHVGLLLSCGATYGIVYTMRFFGRIAPIKSLPCYITNPINAIVTTIGAWLGTLPVIIGYFGTATPGGIVMSLLVIPLVFLYTVVGIIFLFIGALEPLASLLYPVLQGTAWALTKATDFLVSLAIVVRYHIPALTISSTYILIIVTGISIFFASIACIQKPTD